MEYRFIQKLFQINNHHKKIGKYNAFARCSGLSYTILNLECRYLACSPTSFLDFRRVEPWIVETHFNFFLANVLLLHPRRKLKHMQFVYYISTLTHLDDISKINGFKSRFNTFEIKRKFFLFSFFIFEKSTFTVKILQTSRKLLT